MGMTTAQREMCDQRRITQKEACKNIQMDGKRMKAAWSKVKECANEMAVQMIPPVDGPLGKGNENRAA